MTEPRSIAAPRPRRPDTAPNEAPERLADGFDTAVDTGADGGGETRTLRAGGVSVVVRLPERGLPEILHWGRDLGDLDHEDLEQLRRARARSVSPSALDAPWPLTLVPGEPDGWEGRPGLAAHRAGRIEHPRWTLSGSDADAASKTLHVRAEAPGLVLRSELRLDDAGVLRVAHELVNTADTPLALASLEAVMPVDDRAAEVLDFTGRWTRERVPQRAPLAQGSRVRETRRGRTGHDAPFALVLGTPGFGAAAGELWATHLAWSGDAVYRHDALPEARTLLGAGPLLRPGEIELAPGESFRTPDAVFVWSDRGLDGLGERFHRSLRARPGHPRGPRPVVLNTWEAVYFEHDLDRLETLARTAAGIGVERFVLDDGWFLGRRDDTAGLGDWTVDPAVWPEGLHPIARTVRALGMEFGLWFEPEMVNPDSDLARTRPDWLLQPPSTRAWRGQYALDLTNPEAFDHLLGAISALVAEYRLDYIKWDQNRDLIEAVHDGRANVHRHTEAVYRLLDRLRARHPSLEIESCASGGARVDLGVLERTDRVWASDTNDPVERLAIQRWTALLLPLELIGSHIGPETAHTTRRASSLDFRIATALFGAAGIEWDLTSCTPAELDRLREGVACYRRLRGLLHTGALGHPDTGDDGTVATAVVADDRDHAVVRVARHATGNRALATALRVPGLDPRRRYRVAPVPELPVPRGLDAAPPPWLSEGLRLPGSVLAEVGLQLPLLAPGEALVLEITALS